MRLRHLTGQILDVDIVDSEDGHLLSCDSGDPFGPLVAHVMFGSFPACVVDAHVVEIDKLVDSGFILPDQDMGRWRGCL